MAEYIGDFKKGATIKVKFNTQTLSDVPITFAGTPQVAIYKDSVVQFTTGVTQPTIDYDGVTGLHYMVIDTTGADYEVGKDYEIVVTQGTVDGQSVVGKIVKTFSIENRNTDANVTQISGDSVAADNAEAFFDGTGYGGTGNTIPTVTTLTNLPSIPANWLTATGISNGAFTSAKFAAGAFDAVWTVTTRTLSSYGTLVADIWNHATRTLTAFTDSSGVTTLLSRIIGTLASGTHQPQSGDAFARIGANGAGLTAIGDTRMANLDATVSSRATQTSLDTVD
jgi:hypothetical protein